MRATFPISNTPKSVGSSECSLWEGSRRGRLFPKQDGRAMLDGIIGQALVLHGRDEVPHHGPPAVAAPGFRDVAGQSCRLPGKASLVPPCSSLLAEKPSWNP
jgi:hypothetical protein